MTIAAATHLVWHRGDLRTHDHPALSAAAAAGPAVGVVVLDPNILDATSERRRALFVDNARALRATYRALGSELIVRTGSPWQELPRLVESLGAGTQVYALRSFTPYGVARDERTAAQLRAPVQWHDGLYIRSPGTVQTRAGAPFRVYSPFLRAWRARPAPEPLDPPARLTRPELLPPAGDLPSTTSDVPLPAAGEQAALAALETFLEHRVERYAESRDRLDGAGGSRLSIWLTIGTLSARTAAAAAWHRRGEGAVKWIGELAWRDFLADLLYHEPELCEVPMDPRWNAFPWSRDEADFEAWRDGRTGVPAIDAAMRQLRETGWISNRARMIAAQFLAKHLRIHWTRGERVFRAWLLDGDRASNGGNWQWAAGLGVDNAPYFRVFNPVSQAREHDPSGEWLRRWVPESNGNPQPLPNAIVDVAEARREYLAAAAALAGRS